MVNEIHRFRVKGKSALQLIVNRQKLIVREKK